MHVGPIVTRDSWDSYHTPAANFPAFFQELMEDFWEVVVELAIPPVAPGPSIPLLLPLFSDKRFVRGWGTSPIIEGKDVLGGCTCTLCRGLKHHSIGQFYDVTTLVQ